MGLSIKNEETERLVRDYAKEHGLSMTEAIRKAILQARAIDGADQARRAERKNRAVSDLVDAFAQLPVINPKVNTNDWMYDENGLPH